LTTAAKTKRVVSGMRPTGRLHIGHYFGALQNWKRLQDSVNANGTREYDCLYFVADWHALTTDYSDSSAVAQNSIEIATDYLAAGIDPAKSVIFLQSAVPEHAELHLLLSMVTPLGWLERVPTYKEALENIKDRDLHTYGFLGYPVLQTADIVIYSEEGVPLFVPVGEDQVSHVELSREIVRRFNSFYGFSLRERLFDTQHHEVLGWLCAKFGLWGATGFSSEQKPALRAELTARITQAGVKNISDQVPDFESFVDLTEVLSQPHVLLTKTPRIPGLDGRKMSKSYGNAITLSESDADIRAKTKVMVTDPARKRRSDPGNPDVCPVYDWHKLFAPVTPDGQVTPEGKATLEWAATGCRTAAIGCIECKAAMADNLIKWIAPIRERRVEYEQRPARVLEVLDQGSQKARTVAQATMERVREAVFGWRKKRAEIS
jgi:tryptophanyl-tRNA synthetase